MAFQAFDAVVKIAQLEKTCSMKVNRLHGKFGYSNSNSAICALSRRQSERESAIAARI